jgi:hypothetical protein
MLGTLPFRIVPLYGHVHEPAMRKLIPLAALVIDMCAPIPTAHADPSDSQVNMYLAELQRRGVSYPGNFGASAVRHFRGAMAGRGEKGLLITTGTFNERCACGISPGRGTTHRPD